MRFIEITNAKSVFNVDGFIKSSRNANGGYISPKIAMEALSKTNHYLNIKLLINEINRLSPQERLEFKDFIGSALNGREHTKDNLDALLTLAEEVGVLDYLKSSFEYNTGGDFKFIYPYNVLDLTKVKKGEKPEETSFAWVDDCSTYYEFKKDYSGFDCVEADGENRKCVTVYSEMPRVMIFRNSRKVEISKKADCSRLDRISGYGLEEVAFLGVSSLRDDFVFPRCDFLVLASLGNLSRFKHLKALNSKKLKLSACYFANEFDFSKFKEVQLFDCKMSRAGQIDFGGLDELGLYGSIVFPKVVDFSNCGNIAIYRGLRPNYFGGAEHIIFRDLDQKKMFLSQIENSRKYFKNVKFSYSELPNVLDFSYCEDGHLLLKDCDKVEHIIFRDLAQKIKFLKQNENSKENFKNVKFSYTNGMISRDMIEGIFKGKEYDVC